MDTIKELTKNGDTSMNDLEEQIRAKIAQAYLDAYAKAGVDKASELEPEHGKVA